MSVDSTPGTRRTPRRAVSGVVDPTTIERTTTPLPTPTPTAVPAPTPAHRPAASAPQRPARAVVPSVPSGLSSAKPAAVSGAPAGAPSQAPSGGRRFSVLTLVLVLVGVLSLGGAAVLFLRAQQERGTESARNLALVDTTLTNEAVGQVSAALNKVFSYDYRNPQATQQAADSLLVGDAGPQYKTLADTLQSKASGQQLVMTAKTVLGGVSTMTPTSARLLIFLDQTSTRASDKTTSTAAAQLAVEAVKQGSTWKISEIKVL